MDHCASGRRGEETVKIALPALVFAIAAGAAGAAEPLGRLFFTPAQRAQLDAARSQKARAPLAANKEESTPAPEVVTYRGLVRRSDGKTTVWINDRAIDDGRIASGIQLNGRVRPDGSIVLEVPQTERSVRLKVGQSVEVLSGAIAEPYRRTPATPKSAPAGTAGGKPAVTTPRAPPAGRERNGDDERDSR